MEFHFLICIYIRVKDYLTIQRINAYSKWRVFMVILVEFLFSILRIAVLFAGVSITVLLGKSVHDGVNAFLQSTYFPCLEVISLFAITIIPFAIYYGIAVRKFFWQRSRVYNIRVFIFTYAIGVALALLPAESFLANSAAASCIAPHETLSRLAHVLGTALVTSLFGLIGMDIGVSLKHFSKRVALYKPRRSSPKSAKKKKR